MDTAKKVEEKTEGKKRIEEIVSIIGNLTVFELAELVKVLQERFGVSAQMPVAVQATAGGAVAEKAEEKAEVKEVNIWLQQINQDKKIQIIKEVRAITNLGLKEAKDMVEGAPKLLKENVPVEEAKKIKEQLEKAGAKIELK